MMKPEQREIERVQELMHKIEPMLVKSMNRMLERDGVNVTLSVSSNIATSLMAMSLYMIFKGNGSTEEFLEVMFKEVKEKYASVCMRSPYADQSTCQPLH
jgi:hypothetical protein